MRRLFLALTFTITAFLGIAASNDEGNENANTESLTNVALLGDSMTWIGGENFEKPTGWTHYILDMPLNMRLYARSGATWCNTAYTVPDTDFYSEVIHPDNVIFNQTLRLINDSDTFNPDIIIIYAGANDAWFADERPGLFNPFNPDEFNLWNCDPAAFTSLASSIVLSSSQLQSAFPNARIFFITPAYGGKIPSESIEKVGDIIEESGAMLSIPVLRGDRLLPFREAGEQPGDFHYTYDGLHSNEQGAKAIADCVRKNILHPYIQKMN